MLKIVGKHVSLQTFTLFRIYKKKIPKFTYDFIWCNDDYEALHKATAKITWKKNFFYIYPTSARHKYDTGFFTCRLVGRFSCYPYTKSEKK